MTMSHISNIISNNYSLISLSHRSSTQRVTGIGSMFFNANNGDGTRTISASSTPTKMGAHRSTGVRMSIRKKRGFTVWSISRATPSALIRAPHRYGQLRVADLDALVKQLKPKESKS